MKNKKIIKKGDWVPLKFSDDISNLNLEGLVGIEELKDYSVTNDKKQNKKNNKKREIDSSDDENEPFIVKKKKKLDKKVKSDSKLKKNKNEKKSTNEEENETEDTDFTINKETWTSLGVPDIIVKALSDQKFQTPTLIQSLTLAPAILGRRDILGAAETGSGKTLAFGIPIINGILEHKKKLAQKKDSSEDDCEEENSSDEETISCDDEEEEELLSDFEDGNKLGCVKVVKLPDSKINRSVKRKPLYALILTPTRELAMQIHKHLKAAAKYTDVQIAVVVGGMAAVKQERILAKGPEIVIATPGRLWELISEKNNHLSQIDSIKYLAIDETDRMLEKSHFEELHSIIDLINSDEKKVQKRQNFVFSATLSLVHGAPDYVWKKKKNPKVRVKMTVEKKLKSVIDMLQIKNPKIVDITKDKTMAGGLTECRITCTIDHKDYYLYYFLKRHPGRTLIFCNSIGCVKRLATLFSILECKPLPLHANMIQRQRLKNLERFQEDSNGILIATDVAARGLDIPNIDHVIHYQVPRTAESYVHRSGRTARAQKEGITVLIMEPSENQFYIRLCKTLNRSHDIPTFPVVDRLLISVKEQVDIAREIDQLELRCKRDNVQKDWIRKAAEEMDILLDKDEKNSTMNDKESANLRKQLKLKKYQLKSLMSRPLFPKGFSGKYPQINAELSLEQNSQKAIDIMKKAIDELPVKKKREKALVAGIKKSKKALKQKMKNQRRSIKKRKDKKEKNNKTEN